MVRLQMTSRLRDIVMVHGDVTIGLSDRAVSSCHCHLGIAILEFFSNIGISELKNGIPGLSPWFWTSRISSNSLVLVSWGVLESWSICWSPVMTYYYVNNCKYFCLSSFLSYDIISLLFNVKRNLLILSRFKIASFFLFLKSLKLLNLMQ